MDIQRRIADILRRIDEETTGGDLSSRMSTGPEEWAEVLASELGLILEQRQMQNTGLAARLGIERLESRYVTEWVPDAP